MKTCMYIYGWIYIRQTYPCEPRAAVGPKGEAPSRLQGLEELVGLEEGGEIPGIDEADDEDVPQGNGGDARLGLERGRRSASVAGHDGSLSEDLIWPDCVSG